MQFTPEMREKAAASRKAKVDAGANLRKDWLDSENWDSLAARAGIRLPQWHHPATRGQLIKWHARLGNGDFRAVYGCSPSRLCELNPRQPLRAFVGQMLESYKTGPAA